MKHASKRPFPSVSRKLRAPCNSAFTKVSEVSLYLNLSNHLFFEINSNYEMVLSSVRSRYLRAWRDVAIPLATVVSRKGHHT